MGRTIRVMVLATVLLAALPAGAMAAGGTGAAAAVQAGPAVVADFNGDGIDDLAVGVPGEDVGATGGAGAVSLVDGAAGGLLGSGNVLITESQPEAGDGFGAALTPGNFDGNELPDLAVGAPGRRWPGVPGAAEAGDRFAAALSA
jgi:FG-GAP repeat